MGRNVVLAARIAAKAKAGEILVSSTLKDYTETDPSLRFEEHGEYHFKGLHGEHVFTRAVALKPISRATASTPAAGKQPAYSPASGGTLVRVLLHRGQQRRSTSGVSSLRSSRGPRGGSCRCAQSTACPGRRRTGAARTALVHAAPSA